MYRVEELPMCSQYPKRGPQGSVKLLTHRCHLSPLQNYGILNVRIVIAYGSRPNQSTGDLGLVTHLWGEVMDWYRESLALDLDISKVFDKVWHKALVSKLPAYGLLDLFG